MNPGEQAGFILSLEFVFPNPQHSPALSAQGAGHKPVSPPIRRKFLSPVSATPCGMPGMLRTTMPETAVHKDRLPRLPENKIRFTKYRLIATPTCDVKPAKQLYQRQFCICVATTPNQRHLRRSLPSVEKISHPFSQFEIGSKGFQYQVEIGHVLNQILSRLYAPFVIHTDCAMASDARFQDALAVFIPTLFDMRHRVSRMNNLVREKLVYCFQFLGSSHGKRAGRP